MTILLNIIACIFFWIAMTLLGAALGRMGGGGLGAPWLDKYGLKWVPTAALAAVAGSFQFTYLAHDTTLMIIAESIVYYVSELGYLLPAQWVAYVMASTICYLGLQTGHHAAYHMGRRPVSAYERMHVLSYIVNPFCRFIGMRKGYDAYCWVFMALKGAIIGVAFGNPIVGAFLWPAAYSQAWEDVEEKQGNGINPMLAATEEGEYLSGMYLLSCTAIYILLSWVVS